MGITQRDVDPATWAALQAALQAAAEPRTTESRKRHKAAELVAAAFVAPGTWVIPVHVVAGDNIGGGKSRAKIGRAGHERTATARVLAIALPALAPFAERAQRGEPVLCTLTRLGGREMDYANVVAAMKYVQDTVALFLGVGDGPRDPVKWEYDQQPRGPSGVRITLSLVEGESNGDR